MQHQSHENNHQNKGLLKNQLKLLICSALLSPLLLNSATAAEAIAPGDNGLDNGLSIVDFTPVTDEMIQNPDPADWLMWRRTLNSWGHSPLEQINTDNVDELRMVWTRGLGDGIQEGTALVHDGIMFFPNPWDVTQAIDIESGDLIWEHRRRLPDESELRPYW